MVKSTHRSGDVRGVGGGGRGKKYTSFGGSKERGVGWGGKKYTSFGGCKGRGGGGVKSTHEPEAPFQVESDLHYFTTPSRVVTFGSVNPMFPRTWYACIP